MRSAASAGRQHAITIVAVSTTRIMAIVLASGGFMLAGKFTGDYHGCSQMRAGPILPARRKRSIVRPAPLLKRYENPAITLPPTLFSVYRAQDAWISASLRLSTPVLHGPPAPLGSLRV